MSDELEIGGEVLPDADAGGNLTAPEQVRVVAEGDRLTVTLPGGEGETAPVWQDLRQQLQQRLEGGEQRWAGGTEVWLEAGDWALDNLQLEGVLRQLESAGLRLTTIRTLRRPTAVAAAALGLSVLQERPQLGVGDRPRPSDTLVLQTTLRSGAEIRHPGPVVLIGDLNPGAAIIADGDILVWGRLRGVAHAGAAGNDRCRILALSLQATQLRIASQVVRVESGAATGYPEVAAIAEGRIRITPVVLT